MLIYLEDMNRFFKRHWRFILFALFTGFVGAFLLFALLGWMIEPPKDLGKKSDKLHLSWAQVSKVDDVSKIKRKPEPPKKPPPMEETTAISTKKNFSPPAMTALPKMSSNDVSVNAAEGDTFKDGMPGLADIAVGDAEPLLLIPIHRQQPQYPIYALRKGIEGSVEVLFKIDPSGRVLPETLEVVKSTPPNVFDRSAVSAIKTWRFEALASGESGDRLVKYTLYYSLPK